VRTTLIATLLFAGAQVAAGQGASQPPAPPVRTIGISADGVCSFEDISVPCDQFADRLVSMHRAPIGQVHFRVDPGAEYRMVAATLASLRKAGIKVGVVNTQPSQ
jgi:biopolymer transport protein ExbD